LWQRPQQLLSRIGRKGYPVLYVAPILKSSYYTTYPNCEEWLFPNVTLISDNLFHLWCCSETPVDIHHEPLSEKTINELTNSITPTLKDLKPNQITYLVQHPGWLPAVKHLQTLFPGKIVYDCMDQHSGFEGINPDVLQSEEELIQTADLVFATSNALLEKVSKTNSNSHLIQNGADFELFHNPQKQDLLPQCKNSKVIGYFGSIKEWFDFNALEHASKKRPGYDYVLVGTVSNEDRARFAHLPNVHFLGAVAYHQLPKYLAEFDVCTIPFLKTPLTEATNPVKLYEYLSAGKPVVSANLPELQPFKEICYLYDSTEEFLNRIDQALEEQKTSSDSLHGKRIEVARQNSWNKRVDLFIEKLQETCAVNPTADEEHRNLIKKLGALYTSELSRLRAEIFRANELEKTSLSYSTKISQTETRENVLTKQWTANIHRVKDHYEQYSIIRFIMFGIQTCQRIKNVLRRPFIKSNRQTNVPKAT